MTNPCAPYRLAVLISGSGSTLLNLIEHIQAHKLDCTIELVVGSRADLQGMQRAQDAGLPILIFNPRDFADTAALSQQVFSATDQVRADLVCLAGWLHLLDVPKRYEQRVLNIHPSLLPRFGGKGMYGMKVHQAVLDSHCTVTGCTVHLVDSTYDTGPILLQRSCPVLATDTASTLAARVFEEEKIAYPLAIQLLQSQAK